MSNPENAPGLADKADGQLFMKSNHKTVTALVGSAVAVLLAAVISYQAFGQITKAAESRQQTYTSIMHADALLSGLTDAETSQRGYLLTGNEIFLEPYLAVRDRINGQLNELRPLASGSAAREHLDAMVPLVTAKLAHMAQAIELRRRQEMTATIGSVSSGQDRRLMSAIRAEMRNFILIEEGVLAQHEEEFQSSMRRLFAMIIAASVLAFLLALLFAWLVYRETQHNLNDLLHVKTRHLLDIQEQTNRKLQQTNIHLQISEEKFAVTLNSIGDAVIATDAEARVVLMNPLAERLTGWKLTEAVNRPVGEIFNIINPDTRQPVVNPVIETLAHGAPHGLANHTLLIARGGNEWSIADSCAPIRARDGLMVGAVLVFRDVTERAFLDQVLNDKNIELERTRSLAEKANLAKSEFLSSMSHELRTPLSAILGFAQLMDSSVPQPTAVQKRSIEQILKAGWHLLDLINEILDLAKIESGKISLSLESLSLASIMQECRAMIESQAQQRGISLIFPEFEVPCFVKSDRTRMKQVLINLLSNAIKYNKAGGSVAVECITTVPGRLRVCVRDDGLGLSPEKITQLFQPFNRLGQGEGGEEGTGIGLVVTKQLIELMGGAIGVDSIVGVGSVFWFEINLASAPQFAVPATGETEWRQRPQLPKDTPVSTLLYVEDNPANMDLVEQLIARRSDLRLLGATDGSMGIEYARLYQPKIILMDINLPGISGTEVMKILRADPLTAHIPIVALSANAMPRDIEKGLEAGFFNYLTKPIKVNEFMDALDVALEFAETTSARATEKGPM